MEPTWKERRVRCPKSLWPRLNFMYSLLSYHLPFLPSTRQYQELPPLPAQPFCHVFLWVRILSPFYPHYFLFVLQLRTLLLEEAFCDLHHVGLHVLAVGAQRTLHTFILTFTRVQLELFMLSSFSPITLQSLCEKNDLFIITIL